MRLVRRIRLIGRRGAYLLSKGALYLGFGFGLSVSRVNAPGYYAVIELIAPLRVWGVVWMAVGVLATVATFVPWIGGHRTSSAAFAGLMAMATLWTIGVLLVYLMPESTYAGSHPWIVAALFASLMASTAVVAGWPEKPRD